MAWYEDLAECTYFPIRTPALRAVGWLAKDKLYTQGRVDPRVYSALVEFQKHPWEPVAVMGLHDCELCRYDPLRGASNIFVPGTGVVYVCPELITHYMNQHAYAPPAEFCAAVLASPTMSSVDYLRAIVANGGRGLVNQGA